MPTSHTAVTIANLALDHIGEFPISTLDDKNPYARWINRNLAHYVETALRRNVWNFACDFFELTADPSKPSFRWRFKYSPPPGWLRVLPLTLNGARGGVPVPHEVKSNFIYVNRPGPLPVECVMNVQNPGEWDPLFSDFIAARLATGMAYRFTAKKTYVEIAKQNAAEALAAAGEVNSFEGSLQPIEQHDIIRARGEFSDDLW